MEKSSFFDSDNGDRKYGSVNWAEYFSSFIENGVFLKTGNELGVNASLDGNRGVILRQGKAFINGYFYYNDSDKSIEIPESHATLNRIDSIVIQWNLSERQIRAKLRSSTPAESPTPVTPVRNAEVWELVVAEIFVGKGSAPITIANIKDKRFDISVCGIVTSVGQPIDTSKLDELIDKLFTRYEELENRIEGATQITKYNALDTSNNIKITADGVTPKVGDIIAVCLTNPSNDGGVQPGATLTFNSDTKPIKCMDGQWTVRPIAQYATVFFAYGNSYWTMLTFDGGMTNKTIAFPSGGNVIPENGVSLYVGMASTDVNILRDENTNTKITCDVIFLKGSATQLIVNRDYNISNPYFDLSSFTTYDRIIVHFTNGAVTVSKGI